MILAAVVGTWQLARSRVPGGATAARCRCWWRTSTTGPGAGSGGSEGDPLFAGTLETVTGTALEGASFVNLYSRVAAHQLVEKLDPGRPLDVEMARSSRLARASRSSSGATLERTRSGYALKLEAIDPADGTVLGTATAAASSPEGMLQAVNTAAARLRGELGDTTPESARMAAAETVTTTSLEALKAYVRAQELAASRKDQEALEAFQEAVELDPEFGRAYAGMGVLYFNLKDIANAQAPSTRPSSSSTAWAIARGTGPSAATTSGWPSTTRRRSRPTRPSSSSSPPTRSPTRTSAWPTSTLETCRGQSSRSARS